MIGMFKLVTLGVIGLALAVGQAGSGCEGERCFPLYASLQVISDPAAASVYTPDGKYWGDTGGTLRIDREIPCAYASRTDATTITLRKQGYQDTVQTVYLDYKWTTQEAAAQHPEVVKIVLQPVVQPKPVP